jgi:hypothetical protein
MSITRRQFLTNVGLSLAASALVSARAMSMGEDRQPASNALDDWSSVRNQFNLSREYIHLLNSISDPNSRISSLRIEVS